MVNKIKFLSNLNKALKQIEQEIVERAIVCLETGEGKLKAGDVFTTDYEVEATVDYYLNDHDEPAHRWWGYFNYKSTIIEKDYDMLLDNGNGTDWHRESYMPQLDEPYCYLLHDLIDHSHGRLSEKIVDIEMIWVDVIYADQKGIKVNKDGSCRRLEYNEKEGGYE
ncbi:MAG: hypothetical protein ABI863_14860 [Ginsengibacter sp.]